MACGVAVSAVAWDDGPNATKLERLLAEPTLLAIDDGDVRGLCPCCGGREIHVFFNRHRANRGGGWVWCSRCRRYLHATVEVPEWWSDLASLPVEVLTARPEGLDNYTQQIDEHLRALLGQRGLDREP
jgi:hypothetical protein